MKTGYLGPRGTFSYAAALALCGNENELTEFPTIFSLIKAVDRNGLERAVVPVENSVEGSVNLTLDTLAFDADVYITGELVLDIKQNLLAKPGVVEDEIKEIVSMSQAIGQCQEMLNTSFPYAKITFTNSTAEAAQAVCNGDGACACIASDESARIYKLDVLRRHCNDKKNNCTKFITIEKKPVLEVTQNDKSSIAFIVNNSPGALYGVLKYFSDSGINMTKIESRPSKRTLGEYVFFVDIDGNADNPNVYFALDNVKKHSEFYKFLGSYKKHI